MLSPIPHGYCVFLLLSPCRTGVILSTNQRMAGVARTCRHPFILLRYPNGGVLRDEYGSVRVTATF